MTENTDKPRRRIRSTTLFTAAVVLGVLGGVGTGYAIQYARPATPLAPLAGTQPGYAPAGVYQGVAPAMLPAAQDDATLTDGDLTKLLLPMPAGAAADPTSWQNEMIDEEENADLCGNAVSCFTEDYNSGVNAIADTSWTQNGLYVEIRIFRMAPGHSNTARNLATQYLQQGTNALTLPGGIEAQGYEFLDKNNENDDTAEAVHGDLAVEFWVTSASKVPDPSVINGLITQQMGRL